MALSPREKFKLDVLSQTDIESLIDRVEVLDDVFKEARLFVELIDSLDADTLQKLFDVEPDLEDAFDNLESAVVDLSDEGAEHRALANLAKVQL